MPLPQPIRGLRNLAHALGIPSNLALVQIALGGNPQHFLLRHVTAQPRAQVRRALQLGIHPVKQHLALAKKRLTVQAPTLNR